MQNGSAIRVISEDTKYIRAYPLNANMPRNAGPKPIAASQNMKNVETAYDRRFCGVFRVTIVVHAEFNVPNPRAAQTAQITTVSADGIHAIKNNPTA